MGRCHEASVFTRLFTATLPVSVSRYQHAGAFEISSHFYDSRHNRQSISSLYQYAGDDAAVTLAYEGLQIDSKWLATVIKLVRVEYFGRNHDAAGAITLSMARQRRRHLSPAARERE